MRFLSALTIVVLSAPVLAVGTSNWTHTTEADFKNGTFDNVVATNLGDLKLSRAVKTLLEQDPQVSSVNTLVEGPDGAIYAGTGPHAILLRVKDETVSTVATIEDATSIFCLATDKQGRLLVGTGGDEGRVLRFDKPGEKDAKPAEVFKAEGVQYVWAMTQTSDGNLYVATGPTGQLFEVKPDGSQRLVLDTDENNLTALVSDGRDLLYVGSDPNGLVYRVNRKTGDSFVLYDAPESEISAIVLDKEGNIYASTAEAKEETPAAGPGTPADVAGRPEGGAAGVPITAEPPKEPKPPTLPDPNPGRPKPIPKEAPKEPEEPGAMRGLQRGFATRCHSPLETRLAAPHSKPHTRAGAPATPQAAGAGILTLPSPLDLIPWSAVSVLRSGAATTPAADPGAGPPKPPQLPVPGRPTTAPAATATAPGQQPAVAPVAAEPRPEGNAVYRIDRDGFVTEVFRQPVLVLSMVERGGTLLLATGSEGQIYQVNPSTEETAVLAKVDPKQVMCLLPAKDGQVYMGLANVGGIAAMSSGFATKGTFISPVLDATQISRFGKVHLHGTLPESTSLTVSTRSGNVKDAAERGWSKWSDEVPATEFMPVTSPSARFLQYRLTFASEEGEQTPVVSDVNIAYQLPNLPPQIKAVKLATAPDAAATANASEGEAPRVPSARRQLIGWEASDPNNDPLQFSVYFRRGGDAPWILLKDKLTENLMEWDTRAVADGQYEVKVVASDATANVPGTGKAASRVSDPILVDNTPPVIGDVKWSQQGADVKVEFRVVDRTGVLAAADYAVDSSKDWQAVLPSDNIWDSPEESASFSIPGLSPGAHQVTVRAADAKGNQAFENVFVTVRGPTAAK